MILSVTVTNLLLQPSPFPFSIAGKSTENPPTPHRRIDPAASSQIQESLDVKSQELTGGWSRFMGYRVRSHRAVQDIVPLQVTKKPGLVVGVHSQSANIVTQLKEDLFVESTKTGFNEALLGGACIPDPEIEGAGFW